MEDSKGERESKCSEPRALLSLLTQQAGDSVQPNIADKAVTVGEGASPDAQEEFSPCYYF